MDAPANTTGTAKKSKSMQVKLSNSDNIIVFKSSLKNKPEGNSILCKNLECKFGSCLPFLEYQSGFTQIKLTLYSRIDFDYNLWEAYGIKYCSRRDVMPRHIGCRSI